MKLEVPKGMTDYEPEVKALRDDVMNRLRIIFERYGFNPLETPLMEKWDVLAGKYAGGSEILKETYKLTDQGKRELGLRYDLTVPMCRFVGMNPNLKMPFKRYQMGPVFRDGPIKKGRLRQFYQCDVDTIGSKSMLADAEIIRVALDVFDELGLDVVIKVNNRKLLNAMVKLAGITKAEEAIISLDKLEKIGKQEVLKEMKVKGINGKKLLELAEMATLESLEEELPNDEGIKELKELFSYVKDKRVVFTPSLARGLAYYTGTVFEAFSKELDSSLAGGGRFDNMIGQMIGRGDYPATGISFGIEPICAILKGEAKGISKVLVVPIGVRKEADEAAAKLRKAGINTDTDVVEKSISKNLDYANSYNIPFVLIIGEKEVKEGKFTLKDMDKGSEEKLTMDEVVKKLT